ncbi:MAG: type VI secretion system baseplate subunit TssG [Sedimentisphaerales bacterium]|nr:type VI secretion system baseplate subunit TssG [Sedimentisphaerales bacterium]
MAAEIRTEADSLIERLQNQPWEFDFFQAVRRLECVYRGRPLVGRSKRPKEDIVRFRQSVSLAFAPSAVSEFHPAADQPIPRMFVRFMGLLGTNGPMPLHLTQHVRDRIRGHGDRTLASFLDIFNHRMISLFYRAWACNQQNVSYDRMGEDRFAAYIGSLFGIGEASFRNRDSVADLAKLHYSGRLVLQTKNAEGLQAILQDYFGIPVHIRQFVGQWLSLSSEYRCRLGSSPESAEIGHTLIVGDRFWECRQKFRIEFGPMGFSDYLRMLPGGESLLRLIAWVRNYVGDELNWELQLILNRSQVPGTCLGKTGRLGWYSWLKSKPFESHADDLVLRGLVA